MRSSVLSRHPNSTSSIADFDPNNDFDKDAIMAWLQLSDFYIWPHLVLFSSLEHLMELLQSTDFNSLSSKMRGYSDEVSSKSEDKWRQFLRRVRDGRTTRLKELPTHVNEALTHSYGIKLDLQTKKCFGLEQN
jgi:hypothetical protein